MSATETQLVQTEVFRPQGWNDEFYKQFVEFITFIRELEALGGSEGLLSLVAEPQVNDAALFAVKESALNWAQGTGFKADVWSDGWFKRTIHVKITTEDGHITSFTIISALGALIWGTKTVNGQLAFNDWNALKAGTNTVTVNNSGHAPINVNGTVQGEFTFPVPPGVPPFSLTVSFNW